MKNTDTKQKQRKFLDEYSNTLDLKASALAAGYKKQTALANARNMLRNPAAIKELKALCEWKAAHLEICRGYIVLGYLKILDWALSLDENGKPNDTGAALRALDGVIKQMGEEISTENNKTENFLENSSIVTSIKGLDPNKI